MKLSLKFRTVRLELDVFDTPTAKALLEALPFESTTQTWGDEVYFATPIKARLEKDARQVVEAGTVCFWTEGDAIALPYGRTPISSDERPSSPAAATCWAASWVIQNGWRRSRAGKP